MKHCTEIRQICWKMLPLVRSQGKVRKSSKHMLNPVHTWGPKVSYFLLCWCTHQTTNHNLSASVTQSSPPSLQWWSRNSILAQTTWRRVFFFCTDICQFDGLFLFCHCLTLLALSFISVSLVVVHWLLSTCRKQCTRLTTVSRHCVLSATWGVLVADSKQKRPWASVL